MKRFSIDIEGWGECSPFPARDFGELEHRVVATEGCTPGKTTTLVVDEADIRRRPVGIVVSPTGRIGMQTALAMAALSAAAPMARPAVEDANRQLEHYANSIASRRATLDHLAAIVRRIDCQLKDYKGKFPGRWLVQQVQEAKEEAGDWAVEQHLSTFIAGAYPLGSWTKARRFLWEYDKIVWPTVG